MTPSTTYNPDVLTCLANLSNDEVFTPPSLANQILDLLPVTIWQDKDARFLDPVCKSGVFLREIAKRLLVGLESAIPDQKQRIDHIYRNQLFGIGITELTGLLARRSLYCSKNANGPYSVCDSFTTEQGNITFTRIEHTWKNGNCIFCGASKEAYDRADTLETYAYQFIHTEEPKEIFKEMKFDVIIGNPPYQLSDGGPSKSASPIYNLFIEQAKKLDPRYITMIIPSRWFAGGKGLDEFRSIMLNDSRIRKIVDFENATDVFPGVEIAGGICFFLWERDNKGFCEITNQQNGRQTSSIRSLNEYPTFIRQSRAVPVIRKVLAKEGVESKRLSESISPSKPFGLRTFYSPKDKGTPCWFIQKVGRKYADKADFHDDNNLLDKWKLLIPPAPIAGQTDFSKPVGFYYDGNTVIAKPGECCTESWLVAGAFLTEQETVSFKSYLFTKTVRFLLLQSVVSQHVTRKNFFFVPDLNKYEGEYTDDILRERWGITQEEWEFIDSRIK